jgi:AraC family transcriptional regulator, regulatory protein of adaptative response / methylphosphotriester-DNA alkyltransferase methyltransferase
LKSAPDCAFHVFRKLERSSDLRWTSGLVVVAIRHGTAQRRRALYQEAVEIIEREYADDLELDAVARRLATSRRQLQRAFAEAGRTSFRTLLAEVRMRRAHELLREGTLPVREVAARVGYRQAAQFAKTFRRHHGRTPSSIRREGAPPSGDHGGAAAAGASVGPTGAPHARRSAASV